MTGADDLHTGDAASTDTHWMRHALALARQGVGLASPNPTVGCALVRDARIVGSGFHEYARRDHAEIVALRQAGEAARGATAYVTLEPCSHYGRTGPCARALIEAGIGRVAAATVDPNPLVAGRGLAMLREAGIEVALGPLAEEARALNDAFAHFIRRHAPFVTLKIAATLDGAIAPPPSAARVRGATAITGADARARVQQMRHAHDALVTGIGTVLADDPLLTDRSNLPRRRPLLRVVLDSELRLPLDSRILASANDDLVLVTHSGDRARHQPYIERGAQVMTADAQADGGISIRSVLQRLGEQDRIAVMIEAGSRLNRGALASDVVDKISLFTAPCSLGPDAVPIFAGEGRGTLPRLLRERTERLGDDTLTEGYVHDPWQLQ